MNGFGRWIKIQNKDSSYYIGNWHKGKFHGYGKFKTNNGNIKEGLWENGNFMPGQKSDIRIGKPIKFDEYIVFKDENMAVKEINEIEEAKKLKDRGGRLN